MNIVVILAGGMGTRMGTDTVKQHIIIDNHQIIEYTLTAFSNSEKVDSILVVSNSKFLKNIENLKEKFPKLKYIIHGGDTRIDSVQIAVKFLSDFCDKNDNIIFSDAVRPCITKREINDLIELLKEKIAVTSAIESYETILKVENENIKKIIPREGILRQTSPEGYKFFALRQLYCDVPQKIISKYKNIGIDQLFVSHQNIGIVKSNPLNFKITTKDDLELFEIVVKRGFINFINQDKN